MGLSVAMRPKRKTASYFEGKTNGICNRTTIDKAAEHRMAGTACRRTADHPGAGGLFCAGDGLWHLCAVAGPAGVDAHAHGHRGVRRFAGICAGKPAAERVLAPFGLFDGADDPGAASVLRPCHAGTLQGLRPAQLLYDLCHERRDLFHHLFGRAAGRGGQGLVHVLHHPAGSVLLGCSAPVLARWWVRCCPSAPRVWIL